MYKLQIYLFLCLLSSILSLLQDLYIDIYIIIYLSVSYHELVLPLVSGRAFYLVSPLLTLGSKFPLSI